jgi:hypothetical protein
MVNDPSFSALVTNSVAVWLIVQRVSTRDLSSALLAIAVPHRRLVPQEFGSTLPETQKPRRSAP